MTDQEVEKIDLTEKKCVVVLGAGASKEAGLPLGSEIWTKIREKLEAPCEEEDREDDTYTRLLILDIMYLLKTPPADDLTHFELNRQINYESLIFAISVLEEQEWAVLGLLQYRQLLMDRLSSFDVQESPLYAKGMGAVFGSAKVKLYNLLESLLKIDTPDADYLLPLLSFCRKTKADIFTLNNDAILESLSDPYLLDAVQCFHEKDVLPLASDNYIRYFKLHGSLHYRWDQARMCAQATDFNTKEPLIIAGYQKLNHFAPFPQMYAEFLSVLNEADVLINIGYSGFDSHISEPILRRACRSNFAYIDVSKTFGAYEEIFRQESRKNKFGKNSDRENPSHHDRELRVKYCPLLETASSSERSGTFQGKETKVSLEFLRKNMRSLPFRIEQVKF